MGLTLVNSCLYSILIYFRYSQIWLSDNVVHVFNLSFKWKDKSKYLIYQILYSKCLWVPKLCFSICSREYISASCLFKRTAVSDILENSTLHNRCMLSSFPWNNATSHEVWVSFVLLISSSISSWLYMNWVIAIFVFS